MTQLQTFVIELNQHLNYNHLSDINEFTEVYNPYKVCKRGSNTYIIIQCRLQTYKTREYLIKFIFKINTLI